MTPPPFSLLVLNCMDTPSPDVFPDVGGGSSINFWTVVESNGTTEELLPDWSGKGRRVKWPENEARLVVLMIWWRWRREGEVPIQIDRAVSPPPAPPQVLFLLENALHWTRNRKLVYRRYTFFGVKYIRNNITTTHTHTQKKTWPTNQGHRPQCEGIVEMRSRGPRVYFFCFFCCWLVASTPPQNGLGWGWRNRAPSQTERRLHCKITIICVIKNMQTSVNCGLIGNERISTSVGYFPSPTSSSSSSSSFSPLPNHGPLPTLLQICITRLSGMQ